MPDDHDLVVAITQHLQQPAQRADRAATLAADTDNSDLLQRAEQAQAQSKVLREQMARVAEAVAKTEQEVARVHRRLAAEGGPLAAEAREHADRAAEVAAKERAEAERLRLADSG